LVFPSAPAVPQAPPQQAAAAGAEKGGPAKSAAAEGPNIVAIKSPMVGTFYSRTNPKAAPFVKPGDHVNPETTVCIIEAMKVFNEIPAEVRGRVVAILVEDGEAVDHGKPLFKIDTAG
jgi:acetyl-CoA carboxylase biotin carboxyl carrier protein